MSKLMLFDFECKSCGHQFEELVQPTKHLMPCPHCGWQATRLISTPRFDPRMGLSLDFPTAAAKWARTREQAKKVDKGGIADGAPNLKMY